MPSNVWHGSPTIGLTYSVHPHMYVLSQILLKHLIMWRKTKTSHFNSTVYVFLPIHVIHIQIIVLLCEYIIFVYLCDSSFHSFSTTRTGTGHCLVYIKKYGTIPRNACSLAKHSNAWLPIKCDYRTDTRTDRLFFASNTKTDFLFF